MGVSPSEFGIQLTSWELLALFQPSQFPRWKCLQLDFRPWTLAPTLRAEAPPSLHFRGPDGDSPSDMARSQEAALFCLFL
jgi:hypothetical protein